MTKLDVEGLRWVSRRCAGHAVPNRLVFIERANGLRLYFTTMPRPCPSRDTETNPSDNLETFWHTTTDVRNGSR